VVEGPHGSGKSTTAGALHSALASRGVECVTTKEPSPTPLGDFIREASEWVHGAALAALIAGDRRYHVDTEIRPALRRSSTVITDRYIPSSLVLQTIDGVPLPFIVALNQGLPEPELTLFLACPYPVLMRRRSERRGSTRFERDGDAMREVELYETVAAQMGIDDERRVMRFDTSVLSPQEIAEVAADRLGEEEHEEVGSGR
jgi:dTMP kinase